MYYPSLYSPHISLNLDKYGASAGSNAVLSIFLNACYFYY